VPKEAGFCAHFAPKIQHKELGGNISKIETVCPYFKKQIVVERNHFGVGEQASAYKTLRGVHFFAPKTAAARRGALLRKSRGKREAACAGRPQSRTGFGFFSGRRNGRNVAVLDQGVESARSLL